MVLSLAVFTVVIAAMAYLRRMNVPIEERFSIEFVKSIDSLKQDLSADIRSSPILTIILIISIIISISALAYVVVIPKQGEKFTEFYILGPGGKAYDYPTRVLAGDNCTVNVGVINHEYAQVNYTMNVVLNNSTILGETLTLQHNQTWEEPVGYILHEPGDQQKLEFLLYKEGNFTTSYRDLHLWVNVSTGEESSQAFAEPKIGSLEITPDIVAWYADKNGHDPQDKKQYAEAEDSLRICSQVATGRS